MILVLFDIEWSPSFWPCYVGTALWFKLFLLFIHLKHVTLAYLLNFISTLSHIFYVYMPLSSASAEFLSNKVASVDTVYWRDMSLWTTMLIYLMLLLVHYPITIYMNLLTSVYYVCLCNFDFFVKFIFTFVENFICYKLFSEINYYWLTDWLTGLTDWLTDWTDWLTNWLTDWTDWLMEHERLYY